MVAVICTLSFTMNQIFFVIEVGQTSPICWFKCLCKCVNMWVYIEYVCSYPEFQ